MAGSITGTIERNIFTQQGRPQMVKLTLTCIADAANHDWPATVVNTLAGISDFDLRGLKLYSIKSIPDGTTPPTNTSNLTVTDMYGIDLLSGRGVGAILSASKVWLYVGPTNTLLPALVQDTLTVNLSGNSVNSAKLTLILELVGL